MAAGEGESKRSATGHTKRQAALKRFSLCFSLRAGWRRHHSSRSPLPQTRHAPGIMVAACSDRARGGRFHAGEAASRVTRAEATSGGVWFRRGDDWGPCRPHEDTLHCRRLFHGDRGSACSHAGLLRHYPARVSAVRHRRAGRGPVPQRKHRARGRRTANSRPYRGGPLQRRHLGRTSPRGPRAAYARGDPDRNAGGAPAALRSRYRVGSPRSVGPAALRAAVTPPR